ncbi:MAG: foldase protein PrsA [Calditrichia bacterium]
MRMTRFYSLLFLASFAFVQCSSERVQEVVELAADKKQVVAAAGEITIDWHQLWRSYHLEPRWGRGMSKAEAYANQINYLIDQKLYVQEALKSGLDQQKEIQGQLEFAQNKELIKALYRSEVASHVEISDAEYTTAYDQIKRKVKLAFAATPNLKRAEQYRALLQSKHHAKIQILNPVEDELDVTPMYSFGDMDERIERAAFALDLHEVSEPIRIEGKYRVVKLIDAQKDLFMSEMDFAENKSRIHKIIFARKARKYSDKILYNLLKDQNIDIKREAFFALLKQFETIVEDKESTTAMPIYLSNPEINKTTSKLADQRQEVLVSFRGGHLTIERFLQNLLNRPTGMRPQVNMAASLKKAIAVAVRDHKLVQMAKQKGLQKDPTVVYETALQSDKILSRQWLKQQRDRFRVHPEELSQFTSSERLKTLKAQFGDKLDDAAMANVRSDYFFTKHRMQLSDSLRGQYAVNLDSLSILKNIGDPNTIIDKNEIDFAFREDYQ